MSPRSSRLRVGVLLSGEGTSLENLLDRIDAGEVPAEVAVVVSSRARAGGLERARRRDIPAVAVSRKQHADLSSFNDAIHAELEKHGVDLVALLGFLSPFEPRGFAGRALNVHPALIPAFSGQGFYGRRVHEAVVERGCKVSGATVHFVDEEYDHGPIVLQEAVPVLDDDTPEQLASRVQAAERRIVPRAIRLYAEGRLRLDGRRVQVLPATAAEPSGGDRSAGRSGRG